MHRADGVRHRRPFTCSQDSAAITRAYANGYSSRALTSRDSAASKRSSMSVKSTVVGTGLDTFAMARDLTAAAHQGKAGHAIGTKRNVVKHACRDLMVDANARRPTPGVIVLLRWEARRLCGAA